jgi:hypothetical protein
MVVGRPIRLRCLGQSLEKLRSAGGSSAIGKAVQHGQQTRAAEVGQANGADAGGVFVDRIDGNDVGVLELGQRMRLVAVNRRYLESV